MAIRRTTPACRREPAPDAPIGGRPPAAAPKPALRMLFFVREPYPTFRPDLESLFFRELLGRGHRIDFVMQANDGAAPCGPQRVQQGTVFVGKTDSRAGPRGRMHKGWLSFRHDLSCLWRARAGDYQAFQFKDKSLTAALGMLAARRKGLRFFYWLSFPFPDAQRAAARNARGLGAVAKGLRARLGGWLLYRYILPRADHVFVQSERMKADLAALGIAPEKMTPVPMGVDAEFLESSGAAPRRRSASPRYVIGYLGSLGRARKLTVLVEMLRILRHERNLDAELLLVGDGDHARDREHLWDRAARLEVADHVRLTGFLERRRAFELLCQSDVCVSPFFPVPYLLSTSPTKLIEYMALGLPVVANDHPEQTLVLRESGAGIIVPWGAGEFAAGVHSILSMPAEERRALSARGRCWVREHRTYPRIAQALDRTYAALLGVRGGANDREQADGAKR